MFHVKPCADGKPAIVRTFDRWDSDRWGPHTTGDHPSTALWSGPLATARSLMLTPGRRAESGDTRPRATGRQAVAWSTALASRAVSRETMHRGEPRSPHHPRQTGLRHVEPAHRRQITSAPPSGADRSRRRACSCTLQARVLTPVTRGRAPPAERAVAWSTALVSHAVSRETMQRGEPRSPHHLRQVGLRQVGPAHHRPITSPPPSGAEGSPQRLLMETPGMHAEAGAWSTAVASHTVSRETEPAAQELSATHRRREPSSPGSGDPARAPESRAGGIPCGARLSRVRNFACRVPSVSLGTPGIAPTAIGWSPPCSIG